jgi:hypothetical protein
MCGRVCGRVCGPAGACAARARGLSLDETAFVIYFNEFN